MLELLWSNDLSKFPFRNDFDLDLEHFPSIDSMYKEIAFSEIWRLSHLFRNEMHWRVNKSVKNPQSGRIGWSSWTPFKRKSS